MRHTLSITVKLDLDFRWARIDVHGCLTQGSCRALVPIVDRCFRILQKPDVVIDLSGAQHIENEGVNTLRGLGIVGPTSHPVLRERTGTCSLVIPDDLPECPSLRTNPRAHGSHRFVA
ncbi:hypothetical protein FJV46_14060 [Arthrobacter agilis]|uniref:hypothetical protein n=1 Tax=Arthrobacter agilis TaxID=37921 RepID=UPI000B34C1F1|nr:hypothetical protein [Arthrobacter agilis]OUM44838.1 hypothetical protein B8W74_02870 [Arthrobacter agilis]PPB47162.1 hypothetical protein CI784_03900 [Arthrobacter agilis]TPV22576.1 hypothetical protein FJV46_14060 [Arthrobacter agilis]VDR32402.1 Uncharacterised protein [Arthrobacter agilis]